MSISWLSVSSDFSETLQAAHDDDRAGRTGLAGHKRGLKCPIFSGFGQFSLYILSLGEQPERTPVDQRKRLIAQGFQRGQRPRGHHMRRFLHSFPQISRPVPGGPAPARPVTRTASRRKFAFLPLLSTRCTMAPGLSASAQAIGMPGKARARAEVDPDPRLRRQRKSCSESAMWRVQSSRKRRGCDEVELLLPEQQQFDEHVQAALPFHVKQA